MEAQVGIEPAYTELQDTFNTINFIGYFHIVSIIQWHFFIGNYEYFGQLQT